MSDAETSTRSQVAALAFFALAWTFSVVASVESGDPVGTVVPWATLGVFLVATLGFGLLSERLPDRVSGPIAVEDALSWTIAVSMTVLGAAYLLAGWDRVGAWVHVATGTLLGVGFCYADLDAHWTHVGLALGGGLIALGGVYGVVTAGVTVPAVLLVAAGTILVTTDQLALRSGAFA